MSSSVVVSRDSRRPPGSALPSTPQRRAASSINCNRCRKPLSTTVYLCACDCVFCEGKFWSAFWLFPFLLLSPPFAHSFTHSLTTQPLSTRMHLHSLHLQLQLPNLQACSWRERLYGTRCRGSFYSYQFQECQLSEPLHQAERQFWFSCLSRYMYASPQTK